MLTGIGVLVAVDVLDCRGAWAAAWFRVRLHPWVGLYLHLFGRLHVLVCGAQDMLITDVDKQWSKTIGEYIQNEDEEQLPEHARSGSNGRRLSDSTRGRSALFWVIFYGAIVLLLTGLVLWFPEYIPWSFGACVTLPRWFIPVAALLTMADFMIHIYMGACSHGRGSIRIA